MDDTSVAEKTFKKSAKSWIFINRWKVAFSAAAIILVVLIFLGRTSSGEEIGNQIVTLLQSQVPGTIILQDVTEESGLYRIDIIIDGQLIPLYATKDGKLFGTMQPLTISDSEDIKIVDVSEDDDAVIGEDDAPVTIIEFSDFECPFCSVFWRDTLPLIEENYVDTGKVKIIFRDFPLDIHDNAQKAAEAAECAREQGGDEMFWEYHDVLFDNQDKLSLIELKNYASQLGLDIGKFNSCLDSGKFENEVLADLQDGIDAGVSGTPSFFVNGKMIEGAQPYSVFKMIIDDELA
jgi:protein-disulfide isomerase